MNKYSKNKNEFPCYEVCPHCEKEVELPSEIGVHKCPSCGKWIVNCNVCPLVDDEVNHCKDCILCIIANDRNKEEEKEREIKQTSLKQSLFKKMCDLAFQTRNGAKTLFVSELKIIAQNGKPITRIHVLDEATGYVRIECYDEFVTIDGHIYDYITIHDVEKIISMLEKPKRNFELSGHAITLINRIDGVGRNKEEAAADARENFIAGIKDLFPDAVVSSFSYK